MIYVLSILSMLIWVYCYWNDCMIEEIIQGNKWIAFSKKKYFTSSVLKRKAVYCAARFDLLSQPCVFDKLQHVFDWDFFTILLSFSSSRNWTTRYLNIVLPWAGHSPSACCESSLFLQKAWQVGFYTTPMVWRCIFRQWSVSRSTNIFVFFLPNCRSSSVLVADWPSINMRDCLSPGKTHQYRTCCCLSQFCIVPLMHR